MKKYIKYLLLCSLCMIIGEGFYLSNTSDNYQVENVIKAYDIAYDNENQCIKEDDDPNASNRKPIVLYQYKKDGQYVDYLTTSGEAYVCDNPTTLIITPVIPNCDFDGWYLDGDLTQKVTGDKVGDVIKEKKVLVDDNGCLIGIDYITRLYASCKEPVVCTENYDKTFDIKYYVDGNLVSTQKGAVGAAIEMLPEMGKDGYTFSGWYLDSEFKTKATSITTTEVRDADNCITGYEDVNIYGKFVKVEVEEETPVCSEEYDKTFNVNYYVDGKLEKNVEVNINEDVDLSSLTKDGYTFNGWYTDKELKNKALVVTTVEIRDEKNCITGYKDVNLYAEFTKDKVEVEPTPEPEQPEITPEPENPETSDNIFVFIGLGFVLVLGSCVVAKKLTNK